MKRETHNRIDLIRQMRAPLIFGFRSVHLYRFLRLFLGIVFVGSGLTKMADSNSFAIVIQAYGLIPDNLTLITALLLALLEVMAGIGLLFDIRGSLLLTAGLLLLFLGVLSYGVWLGLDVDCGCFGPEDPEAEAFHDLGSAIFRDVLMLTTILYLYAWRLFHKVDLLVLKNSVTAQQNVN